MNNGKLSTDIRLLVIDASDLGRACITAVLESQPGFEVRSSPDLKHYEHDLVPDLVVFQADMPAGASHMRSELGLAARRWPAIPTLVIGNYTSDRQMLDTIEAGAQGLLTSKVSVACMRSAIMLLVNDIAVYPRELTGYFHSDPASPAAAPEAADAGIAADQLKSLTQRQQDVLKLLALGSSNREIAQRLHISESTVKVHLRAIMSQNGASNRTQIVAHFLNGIFRED